MRNSHGEWQIYFEHGNWDLFTPREVVSKVARRAQGESTVEITEVRIKLMEEPGERLKAFCSITFDNCFVIRDLKIIDGSNGPFVAMPSRKLTAHCPGCGMKNHLRAQYCNQCGKRMSDARAPKDAEGRAKLYADIAHPINSFCREMIQDVVVSEYLEEIERAKQPGYVSRYDDFDFEYTDAPRSKPARFDPSHGHPGDQPHARHVLKTANNSQNAGKPHFRQDEVDTRPAPMHAPLPPTDGFGAGIFPE
jgi:stage V sporulation protein G